MTGSYKLSIYSSTIQYDIDIKYSVSIIKGRSGRGKTHLLRMLDLLLNKDSDSIFCNMKDKLYMLEKNTDWETLISRSKKKYL